MDHLSQEPVVGPGQISDLGEKSRLNSMHTRENERRSETGLAPWRRAEGHVARARDARGLQVTAACFSNRSRKI
jgi:hypothetical protein